MVVWANGWLWKFKFDDEIYNIVDTFSISNFYEAIRHQFISFSLARLSVNVNLCYVYIMLCK